MAEQAKRELLAAWGTVIVRAEPVPEKDIARGGQVVKVSQKAAESLLVGDVVVFAKTAGVPILFAEVEYISLRVDEVAAIVRASQA